MAMQHYDYLEDTQGRFLGKVERERFISEEWKKHLILELKQETFPDLDGEIHERIWTVYGIAEAGKRNR